MNAPRHLRRFAAVAALAVVAAAPLPALANTGQTLGGMVATIGSDLWGPMLRLVEWGSVLVGIFLIATALMRLVEMSNGQPGGGKDAVTRMVGGGALLAMPFVIQSLGGSLTGSTPAMYGAFGVTVATPANCLQTGGGSVPMSCVARNVATNLALPATTVIVGMAWVVGVWIVASGLYKVALSQSQQNQQQARSWFPRIVFGALLTQMPPLMAAVGSTLGFGSGVFTASSLQPMAAPALSNLGGGTMSADIRDLLSNVFVICIMFGAIAVWRGISKLQGHAEGTERDGVASGITHIGGGVMLANIQLTVCFVARTFLGSGLGFCP